MEHSELVTSVWRALDLAPPDAMVTALRSTLADLLNATSVELLLANYQLSALRPVGDPDDRRELLGSPSGTAFMTQIPASAAAEDGAAMVYLPVTVRGNRHGVLCLHLPAEPDPALLSVLAEVATVVGYAVQAAGTQTDVLHRTARSQRLTLAAEIQWLLTPGRGAKTADYELAGHLEPAHHVNADNIDWSQDDGYLLLSVTDGARAGVVASLLTTLAVNALRNARRAGLSPADQASMADQAVYAYHQGAQYISTLLVRIELATGQVSAVRAGSPRLLLLRGDEVHDVELEDQMPLGMFEGTVYTEQTFTLATGDRLLVASDGIHAARSPSDEPFHGPTLYDTLRASADLPPGAVVRTIIENLMTHRDYAELDDDGAVICLDWNGPGSVSPIIASATTAAPDRGPGRALKVVPGPASSEL